MYNINNIRYLPIGSTTCWNAKNVIIVTNTSTIPWNIHTVSFCTVTTNLQKIQLSSINIHFSPSYKLKQYPYAATMKCFNNSIGIWKVIFVQKKKRIWKVTPTKQEENNRCENVLKHHVKSYTYVCIIKQLKNLHS